MISFLLIGIYELNFLLGCLPPKCRQSTMVVIVSRSGLGKSALTDQLLRRAAVPNFALVDPNIRQKSGDARIYDGFFIQQCAQDLSARSRGEIIRAFTGSSSNANGKRSKRSPTLTQCVSILLLPNLYELAIGYLDRLLAKRDFASEALLSSDTTHAVTVCASTWSLSAKDDATLLIIREAQHIDHESLRFFLQNNRGLRQQYLIVEYTVRRAAWIPTTTKYCCGKSKAIPMRTS